MSFVKQTGKINGTVFIFKRIKKNEIWISEIGWPEFCGFF